MVKHTIRAKDGGSKKVSLTPLKAIKYQCLECMGWSVNDVKYCTETLCSLYPYRFGTNPERKGIDGELSSK